MAKRSYLPNCPTHKSAFVRDWRAGDNVEVYCPTPQCPKHWTFPVPICGQECVSCGGQCESPIRDLRLTEGGCAEFYCDHPCVDTFVLEAIEPARTRAAS